MLRRADMQLSHVAIALGQRCLYPVVMPSISTILTPVGRGEIRLTPGADIGKRCGDPRLYRGEGHGLANAGNGLTVQLHPRLA